jgi:hypothetical protein
MAMSSDNTPIPYQNLADIADHLFDVCEDDVKCLSRKIEELDLDVRNELLVSDLLNAWQVFYFFFRMEPDELMQERLELEPASSLVNGVIIDNIDLLELIFSITNTEPVIIVSDGEKPLTTYKGRNAYAEGLKFIENPPY